MAEKRWVQAFWFKQIHKDYSGIILKKFENQQNENNINGRFSQPIAAPDIIKIILFTFLKDLVGSKSSKFEPQSYFFRTISRLRLVHWPTDGFWWKAKKINPVIITSGVLAAVVVFEAWNVLLNLSVSINSMTIRILRWLMLQFLRCAWYKQTDKQKAILKFDSHTHTPSIHCCTTWRLIQMRIRYT